jgi:two-component system, NtrC family, response regulator AtoC
MQNHIRFMVMKKILIVDDDNLFLEGFDKVLQTCPAQVTTVENGNQALQAIKSSHYDLCFLDLFLPDLNGTEVLKQMKKASPRTKVIAMTAGVVTPSMQETIEKDAYMFITKPLDLLQIRMLTRRIIEEATEQTLAEH